MSRSVHTTVALTAQELALFRRMIYEESGIALSESKKALLEGRLARRLRELGIDRFVDYYRLVTTSAAERQLMLDRVTTHETRFFRGPWPFELLDERVLPGWRSSPPEGRRLLRAWSAGCSTGEEAYSLAMHLLDQLPSAEGWRIDILATDISTEVLERAQAAVFSMARVGDIPPAYLKRYMLKGTGSQSGRMRAGPELRAVVHFRPLNLHDEDWPSDLGAFDLVFCRNVFIYFDTASRQRAVGRLIERLKPHGLLVVGHAESLAGSDPRIRFLAPGVYALTGSKASTRKAPVRA